MRYVALVVILALSEYMFFTAQVGRMRARFGIRAPAISGNEEFERYFRVQQNTLEQLVLFLPAIYLFAVYVHALTAALLGLVFITGRGLYYRAYTRDPASRGPGMMVGGLASMVLLAGAACGILWSLF